MFPHLCVANNTDHLLAAAHSNQEEWTRAAREVADACATIGFFTVIGHGVPLHPYEPLPLRQAR
jgi:isopenicillin N synthase-like dioxygenase